MTIKYVKSINICIDMFKDVPFYHLLFPFGYWSDISLSTNVDYNSPGGHLCVTYLV